VYLHVSNIAEVMKSVKFRPYSRKRGGLWGERRDRKVRHLTYGNTGRKRLGEGKRRCQLPFGFLFETLVAYYEAGFIILFYGDSAAGFDDGIFDLADDIHEFRLISRNFYPIFLSQEPY
jgi:hypothetical protein